VLWNWPKIRAALIAAVLLIGAADGIPRTSPKVLARLPPALRWANESLRAVGDAILAPVTGIGEAFQVHQRWELFTASRDERFRLWIEARTAEGEPWELLFRAHDIEHRWFGAPLEYRRVRGAWNPSRRGATASYPAFVTWVARRGFAHDSRFQSIRVRAEQIRILPRGLGFVGTGEFLHVQQRDRKDVAP